jgi:hypothetical protein
VFWNFGWDLTDRLRAAGFTTTVLVTDEYDDVLRGELAAPAAAGSEFDVVTLVRDVRIGDLTRVATTVEARRMGLEPSHQFATWECLRP